MSKEQLDAVKKQLLSEDNDGLMQTIFSAYMEEPERGANMIISYAEEKGLKLDVTAKEVIDYMSSQNDDTDIELSAEDLKNVAGGICQYWGKSADGKDYKDKYGGEGNKCAEGNNYGKRDKYGKSSKYRTRTQSHRPKIKYFEALNFPSPQRH